MSDGEKRKRVRAPVVKRDPVIAALIAKLPAEATEFTRPQRVNWLRQMAMAMDGAYGVEPQIVVDVDSPVIFETRSPPMSFDAPSFTQPVPPAPPITGTEETRYFIAADGTARMEPGGKRIDPFDIPDGSDIEDEREGDDALDTIKWKSGQFPPAAYPERSFNIMKAG